MAARRITAADETPLKLLSGGETAKGEVAGVTGYYSHTGREVTVRHRVYQDDLWRQSPHFVTTVWKCFFYVFFPPACCFLEVMFSMDGGS